MMRKFIAAILFSIFYSFSGYAFFEKDIRVLTMQNGLADNTVLLFIRIWMVLCGLAQIIV